MGMIRLEETDERLPHLSGNIGGIPNERLMPAQIFLGLLSGKVGYPTLFCRWRYLVCAAYIVK